MHNCDDQSYLVIGILRSSNMSTFIYSVAFFTFHGYITNSQSGQLPLGLIAQLLEHCTGIREAAVLSLSGLNVFQALISQLIKLYAYLRPGTCDDQSYLRIRFSAVQIYELSYIFVCILHSCLSVELNVVVISRGDRSAIILIKREMYLCESTLKNGSFFRLFNSGK